MRAFFSSAGIAEVSKDLRELLSKSSEEIKSLVGTLLPGSDEHPQKLISALFKVLVNTKDKGRLSDLQSILNQQEALKMGVPHAAIFGGRYLDTFACWISGLDHDILSFLFENEMIQEKEVLILAAIVLNKSLPKGSYTFDDFDEALDFTLFHNVKLNKDELRFRAALIMLQTDSINQPLQDQAKKFLEALSNNNRKDELEQFKKKFNLT